MSVNASVCVWGRGGGGAGLGPPQIRAGVRRSRELVARVGGGHCPAPWSSRTGLGPITDLNAPGEQPEHVGHRLEEPGRTHGVSEALDGLGVAGLGEAGKEAWGAQQTRRWNEKTKESQESLLGPVISGGAR